MARSSGRACGGSTTGPVGECPWCTPSRVCHSSLHPPEVTGPVAFTHPFTGEDVAASGESRSPQGTSMKLAVAGGGLGADGGVAGGATMLGVSPGAFQSSRSATVSGKPVEV